jgi:hypothetical protein
VDRGDCVGHLFGRSTGQFAPQTDPLSSDPFGSGSLRRTKAVVRLDQIASTSGDSFASFARSATTSEAQMQSKANVEEFLSFLSFRA